MDSLVGKTYAVTGATGRQGSAVVRHLIRAGAHVRALTRNPNSPKARKIQAPGVELVQGDLADREALKRLVQGADGVYSVQNPYTSSFTEEVQQGKNVADAVKAAGAGHLVQGSAGVGTQTGVPSWDSKVEIQAHLQSLGIPFTVLRPMAFMELMTDPAFYPMAGMFHLMPKLAGADTQIPWLAVDDLGAIAVKVFANPQLYAGQQVNLASDLKSVNEVSAIYQEVLGKKPPHFPMPLFLFRMFTGEDVIIMWKYLRHADLNISTDATRAILPEAQSVRTFLTKRM